MPIDAATISKRWLSYIDGRWTESQTGDVLPVENPSTGEHLAQVAQAGAGDVDAAVDAASRAFATRLLADMRPADRGAMMLDIARHLKEMSEDIAVVDCLESGKPIHTARNEPAAAVRYFTYYGGLADKLEGVSIPLGADYVDYTIRAPFGVSAQIVPWNFPLQIAARSIACAIATGNTVVLKTPELSPLACTYLAEACSRAGVPDGVVNIICGYGNEAGAALVAHSGIDHIVFTGSVATGQSIMCAAAERVIPSVMELGGKSAAVVYPDADLAQVVASTTAGIFTHAGQVCSAASRLVVHRSVHDDVVEKIAERVGRFTIGPAIEGPDLGPVISEQQLAKVEGFVQRASAAGGQVVTGGKRVGYLPGHFMEPTIVTNVAPDSEIVQSEVFGPVLVVQSFEEPEEAVELANGTDYGLCAGVHTNDLRLAHWTAERLVAGQVFVNEWFAGGVETPFGGTKRSGFGREKGQEALLNYVQTKNVAIRIGGTGTGRPGG
ncbi:aldehyde dehydrogenase family protein [Mycobacterium sp. SMC-2]|uniref:aldehyde dehydrogenase family protein n=1 Tax=Mycobacterium sp. SMC-2 TaxID=2857058 RepID=UPI0021B1B4A0|nr:aldehyde dehydrogenase family protein [Mycobacterium sp. SMC-2]UXA05365.1 aldehyde dehydrogenase family protein [Mycobacterium sp. SMC-2]